MALCEGRGRGGARGKRRGRGGEGQGRGRGGEEEGRDRGGEEEGKVRGREGRTGGREGVEKRNSITCNHPR